MAPSCWFFWAWWIPLISAVTTAEKKGEVCSAKRCGNLTISDPFWLVDMETGVSCGSSDFEVACYNNTPLLRNSGLFGFAIIDIAYEEHSMRAVDQGKLTLLDTSKSCGVLPTWNTSAKVGRTFRIKPGNLDLIFYNCTEEAAVAAARREPALVQTRIRCGNESQVLVRAGGRYAASGNYAGYAVEGCEAIIVPVLGSSGEVNASDYKQLIEDGFFLTWDGIPPLLAARKFAHLSNHLKMKFLARTSRSTC